MFKFLREYIERIKRYNAIANIAAIARRYFVMNAFDGILTTTGVFLAAFFAGIREARIIIIAGVGAAVAIGISGFWGAYLTESAERKRILRTPKKILKIDAPLKQIKRSFNFAIVSLSLVDGLSPLMAALIMTSPFIFSASLGFNVVYAYYASFIFASLILFFLGTFLGKISRQKILSSGLKMIMAGVVCAIILYLIQKRFGI